MINKRKKNSRQRGSSTHGWGAKKKHRGSGNKGGKGMAGTGKRADSKKPSYWKDKRYMGKWGFKKKNIKVEVKPVNISYIEDKLDNLLNRKIIKHEKGAYELDLEKLGYNKLLSEGNIKNTYRIKALFASKKAIEKITSAGGEVILPKSGDNGDNVKKNNG